jgi:hypothetical protein
MERSRERIPPLLFKALAPENSLLKYPARQGYQIDRLIELAARHADDCGSA